QPDRLSAGQGRRRARRERIRSGGDLPLPGRQRHARGRRRDGRDEARALHPRLAGVEAAAGGRGRGHVIPLRRRRLGRRLRALGATRGVIARILLWSLFDSKTTVEELREQLPDVVSPSTWIWNEASERFGLIVFGDDLPDGLDRIRDLIGSEPDV